MHLSQLISAQDLQLYYQVACKGRADLQLAVTQEQGFEMCILRLLAFRPLQPNEVLVSTAQQATLQNTEIAVQAPIEQMRSQADAQPAAAITVETQAVDSTLIQEPSSDDFLDEVVSEPAQPSSTSLDQIIFDPAADELLFDLDDSNENTHRPVDDEPSSDDFLFDEIAPLPHADIHDEPKLTVHPVVALESDLFLTSVQNQAETLLPLESVDVETAHVTDQAHAVVELQSSILDENTPVIDVVPDQDCNIMPQDILRLTPQQLEGEWTLDKWEYWFRHSSLSPAVQELAQQGVMSGQIDGQSTFQIAPKYEQLLNQLQHALEQALKEQWANTQFEVKYADVSSTTPYFMQNERKQRAYARAAELLHAESAVKDLLHSFEGEIQNIQLE